MLTIPIASSGAETIDYKVPALTKNHGVYDQTLIIIVSSLHRSKINESKLMMHSYSWTRSGSCRAYLLPLRSGKRVCNILSS